MNPLLLAPLALTAGVLSFSSPCCLPLLPGYVAFISSAGVDEPSARSVRVRSALLFVAGFSIVFTALGAGAALLGSGLTSRLPLIEQISGVVLIAGGVVTFGLVRLPMALQRDRRRGLGHLRPGPAGAVAFGAAFAAGWSPCIGPVLASILSLTAGTGNPQWGAVLLLVYSLGLGLPFVLLAAGVGNRRWMPWLRAHTVAIERTGGAALVVVGVLLLTGVWSDLLLPVQRSLGGLQWPPI